MKFEFENDTYRLTYNPQAKDDFPSIRHVSVEQKVNGEWIKVLGIASFEVSGYHDHGVELRLETHEEREIAHLAIRQLDSARLRHVALVSYEDARYLAQIERIKSSQLATYEADFQKSEFALNESS